MFYRILQRPLSTITMRVLNVAEKNDAAKNIAAQLSRGSSRMRDGLSRFNKIYEFQYNVMGRNCHMVMTSVAGHLLSYEFAAAYRGWMTCDPVALFDAPIHKSCLPDYEPIKKSLEREVRTCDMLVIWTDCDREGENIGFEVIDVCKAIKPNITVYRAKFSEITRRSVERAIDNLEQPNQNVNDAVEVRMQLDLRIGAAFTRFQTLRLKRVFPQALADSLISYGSCQFPTLGFVVERYKAIADFVPEQFWKIKVTHMKDEMVVEFAWKRNRLFEQLACEVLYDVCKENPRATVLSVQSKQKLKWRPRPLDTVELEKLGSRKLSINAKETMRIAEKLYTQGFISYPRTETNIFPKELNLVPLVEAQVVDPSWGAFATKVLQEGPNPFQGTKSDQAHPPIHPTKYTNGLNGNEKRIYELIVRHFLACLSKHAEGLETVVTINIANEEFVANGLMIIAKNYLDVYPYDKWNAKEIHIYQQGDQFVPDIEMTDGVTNPPNLLTEADLIALMEKHGIGTDATHADIIERIKSRLYVGLRDDKHFVPRTLGMGLVEGYDSMGFAMSKPNLRAELEADLKRICEGTRDPQVVLREQLAKYKSVFEAAKTDVQKLDQAVGKHLQLQAQTVQPHNDVTVPLQVVMKCPSCGSDMCLRDRKNNEGKYIGCTAYPGCKYAIWFPSLVKEVAVTTDRCPQCGPTTHLLQFKFDRGSYLEPDHQGCVGGCDPNFLELLGIAPPSRRPEPSREALRPVTSNVPSSVDSGFVSQARTTQGSSSNQANPRSSWSSSNQANPRQPTFNAEADENPSVQCKCRKPAVRLTVKKSGANCGRLFYKCDQEPGTSGCNFFQWADEATSNQQTQSQVLDVRPYQRHDPVPVPSTSDSNDLNCFCALPCKQLTVRKEGANLGRQFYVCSRAMNDPEKCQFFKWADELDGSQPTRTNNNFNNRTNNNFTNNRNNQRNSGGGETKKRWIPGTQQQPKRRKCGICGQEGHNRKNCSNQ